MPTRPATFPRLRLNRETVRRLTEPGSRDCSVPMTDEPVESRYNVCQLTREC